MIATDWYKEAEFAYKMKATLHPEYKTPKDSENYLSEQLGIFCEKTGLKPYELFERSNTPECVMKKVAFVYFLPVNYSPTLIARFLGWSHSTVYNWRDGHEGFMEKYEYRQIINKLK